MLIDRQIAADSPVPSLDVTFGRRSGTVSILCHAATDGHPESQAIAELGFVAFSGAVRMCQKVAQCGRFWRPFCATLLIPRIGHLRLVPASPKPYASVSLYLLSLLSRYQGVETKETRGTRDGSGIHRPFRRWPRTLQVKPRT